MTAYSKKVIIKLEKNKNKKMHILKSNTSIIKRIAFTKEKKKNKKTNTLKFRFLFILRVSKLHNCLTLETLKYSNNFFYCIVFTLDTRVKIYFHLQLNINLPFAR